MPEDYKEAAVNSIIDEEQINTAKNLINSINQVNPNNFLTQNVSELNIESSGSTFDIFSNAAFTTGSAPNICAPIP